MENLDNAEKATEALDEIKDQTTEEAETVNPLASLSEDQIKAVIAAYEAEKAVSDKAPDPDKEDPVKVSRKLVIVSDKRYGLVKFKREGGGLIPTILSGVYDSHEKAERDLNLYQAGLLKPTPMQATDTHAKPVRADVSAAIQIEELRAQLKEVQDMLDKKKEEVA